VYCSAPAVKKIPNGLKSVVEEVLKAYNAIVARDSFGRVFTISSEILLFSVDHHFQLSSCLCDIVGLRRLAYLADIL
jgi:hypothetical protein